MLLPSEEEEKSPYAVDNELNPQHESGQQELLENKVNRVLYG